jgi:hypothetical protein
MLKLMDKGGSAFLPSPFFLESSASSALAALGSAAFLLTIPVTMVFESPSVDCQFPESYRGCDLFVFEALPPSGGSI